MSSSRTTSKGTKRNNTTSNGTTINDTTSNDTHTSDGTRNTRSIHAGCDVRSGEKWAANIWLNSQGGMSLLSRPEPPESAAPALATLRAELRQMRLAALYKRAVQVGVSADDVDAVMDGDNARDSLTAMILEAAQEGGWG